MFVLENRVYYASSGDDNYLENKSKRKACTTTPIDQFTIRTRPIKIVENSKLLGAFQSTVVKGQGICTAVAAIPHFANKQTTNRVWQVLLDSGSEGDLVFNPTSPDAVRVPYKERYAPQRWRTSNGIFETTKVGRLELEFPEYSKSKRIHLKPDIIDIPAGVGPPTYDLILGVETMADLGIILDFNVKAITIDGQSLPMRPIALLNDQNALDVMFSSHLEPAACLESTNRAVEILDANYEKADLGKIVNNCAHLNGTERTMLLALLLEFEELFDGTLGDWKYIDISLELKKGETPFAQRVSYCVPHLHLETLKKEVERLVLLGVLKRQDDSEWASPTFIIPKPNKTVRFVTDFREVNKRLVRKPFPLPKITTILQEVEGFRYATSLDLNMGYYTIRLDADSQKICTIILPWGKYSYLRLPMGIAGSPDIFQEKMSGLMEDLDYVRTYLDDLLTLTKSTFEDHLNKLRKVLEKLLEKGLRVNAAKSHFGADQIEYLGYMLTRDGVKPQAKKIEAILALKPPRGVKELRGFLGMMQY